MSLRLIQFLASKSGALEIGSERSERCQLHTANWDLHFSFERTGSQTVCILAAAASLADGAVRL